MIFEELFPNLSLETTEVEFKGILNSGAGKEGESKEVSWLKTIASFANGSGGDLFIGVEDKKHTIVALDHETADKQVVLLHQTIKQRLEPAIHYEVIPHQISNGEQPRFILQVKVKPSTVLPVFLHEKGAALVFVRDFAVTRLATAEEMRSLVLSSDNITYDAMLSESKYEEKDFSLLHETAKARSEKDIKTKELISLGFCSGDLTLSKGALLFKDDCQSILTRVDVAFYPSVNKGMRQIIAPRSFFGPITKVIDEVVDYVEEHSEVVWRKTDEGRVNQLSFPKRALMEGVANALCHRNYYINTSIIEISVFVDRLEIVSPGALLGVKKIDKLEDIASINPRRRNEVIARTLQALNYIESKGSGFELISEEYLTADKKHKPYIKSDSVSFTLVLPNLNYEKGLIDEENDSPEIFVDDVSLAKRDIEILSFCYIKRRSAKEIANRLGVASSSYLRMKVLGSLVGKKLLILDQSEAYPTYLTNHSLVRLTNQ